MNRYIAKYLLGALLGAMVLTGAPQRSSAENPPVIAAASSLRFVLQDVAEVFTRETGLRVRLSYGSSGNIARQIAQGAPYQLFLSADETYVHDLAAAGWTVDGGRLYAYGRIVLFVAEGSALNQVDFPDGYGAVFKKPGVYRFAIANPVHAPYGRAARPALSHAKLWTILEPSLLYGENVAQAGQFAASGSADGGIIAQSVALALASFGKGSYQPIPADWHGPLGQRMVLIKGAGETAQKFYAFMNGEKARELLEQYGFVGLVP